MVQETVQCHKVEKRILRPVGEENRAECAGHEQTDADLSQCLGMAQKLAEIQETGQITQVQGESVAVQFSCQRQNDILSDRQKEGGERRDPQKLFCVDSAKAGSRHTDPISNTIPQIQSRWAVPYRENPCSGVKFDSLAKK